MDKNREIGSEFYIDETNTINFYPYLFRSGRDSLFYLAKSLKKKSVLLPAYSCSSMTKPFLLNDCIIFYYDINKKFQINEEQIKSCVKKNHIELLLVINYFGINVFSNNLLNNLKLIKKNLIIIEDKTQNIYDKPFLREPVNFAIASLRKWFNVSDGALLASHNILNVNYNEDNTFATNKRKTMILKSKYLNDKKVDKDIMLQEFFKENNLLDTINAYSISKESMNTLNLLEIPLYKTIRMSNFDALNFFINTEACEKVTTNNASLYFPILINNREYVKSELAKKGIYCPIIWEIDESLAKKFNDIKYLSNHILAIPCDHRYTFKDMLYIGECLNEILCKK